MAKVDGSHIEAFVQGGKALAAFGDSRIAPLLKANQSKTPYQEATAGTFYRMQLQMRTLSVLPEWCHFQTVLSTARGLYELLIDLKLLQASPGDAEKYHDFAYVSRFAAAKKYVDEVARNPGVKLPTRRADYRAGFVSNADNFKRFDDLREKNWGRDKKNKLVTPEHWSGLTMPERAKRLSLEELLRYRSVYAQYCWFVHSGSVGTSGITEEGLVAGFGWGLAESHVYFTEAIELVCSGENLFDTHDGLRDEFNWARSAIGRVYSQLTGITELSLD